MPRSVGLSGGGDVPVVVGSNMFNEKGAVLPLGRHSFNGRTPMDLMSTGSLGGLGGRLAQPVAVMLQKVIEASARRRCMISFWLCRQEGLV